MPTRQHEIRTGRACHPARMRCILLFNFLVVLILIGIGLNFARKGGDPTAISERLPVSTHEDQVLPQAPPAATSDGEPEANTSGQPFLADSQGTATRPGVAQLGNPVAPVATPDSSVPTQVSGLESLAASSTVLQHWPNGEPVEAGWHRRVRTVSDADLPIRRLRLEEQVLVKWENNRIEILEVQVERAMAADHILLDASSARDLPSEIEVIESERNPHVLRVPVPDPDDPTSLPEFLQHLDHLVETGGEPDEVLTLSATPNDPLFGTGIMWHLENLGLLANHKAGADIDAIGGWDIRQRAPNTLIAILDSGFNHSDPDLASAVHVFEGETIGDGIDNDGNGYVDDVFGYDFAERDGNPSAATGHGNACALIMAAVGGNSHGGTGILQEGRILNCRIFGRSNLGFLSDAVDAIDYARESGADILNLSWNYLSDAPVLEQALRRCSEADILMVCSSGNSGNLFPLPAPAHLDLPLLVVVAASTPEDTVAPFSNVDSLHVDLAAPGVSIPIQEGSYTHYVSGTSFAAPLVCGALALAREEFPNESPDKLIQRLLETVEPIPGALLRSGGRLNLARLLGTATLPVAHDTFADRRVLHTPAGIWRGRNNGANVEGFETAIVPTPQRSVWFEWIAPSTGLLSLRLEAPANAGASFTVFSDGSGFPGAVLAKSSLEYFLEVTKGQRLFLMADSTVPIDSGLTLAWSLPPVNDNWSDAIEIEGLPLDLKGTTMGATAESFEEEVQSLNSLPPGSVWWRWTAPRETQIGVANDPGHAVFIVPIAANLPGFSDDLFNSRVQVVEEGKTYAIVVVPQNEASRGPFSISIADDDSFIVLSKPKDVTALAGENVTLSVTVVAPVKMPSFQWYKDDKPIPFAESPTLTLRPVNERSFGSYHVVLSTPTREVVLERVEVRPRNAPPRLIAQNPRSAVVRGGNADFMASFRSATTMTYQWFKKGVPIPGEQGNRLISPNVSPADAGTYALTATNAAGETSVSFTLDVINTPWEGWVERTPGSTGRSAVIASAWTGGTAHALTSHEWLTSDDDGISWRSEKLPSQFTASAAAIREDGSALVVGQSFDQTESVWSRGPLGEWNAIAPMLHSPGSDPKPLNLTSIETFDGKYWSIGKTTDYFRDLCHSTDGETWHLFQVPGAPSPKPVIRSHFSFGKGLALKTYGSTGYLVARGGAVTSIDFDQLLVDQDGIHLAGSSSSYIPDGGSEQATDADWYIDHSSLYSLGTRSEDRFVGLSRGPASLENRFVSGHINGRIISKSAGISSWSGRDGKWLIGYLDGTAWIGTNLADAPHRPETGFGDDPLAFDNEFIAASRSGGFLHSSDGIRWQALGPISKSIAGQMNGRFLVEYSQPHFWFSAPEGLQRRFVDSIFPLGGSSDHFSSITSNRFRSPFGIVTTNETSTGQGPDLFLTRESEGQVVTSKAELGISYRWLTESRDINGRWFLRGTRHLGGYASNFGKFSAISTDGVSFVRLDELQSCVFGHSMGRFVAIESGSRGYFSSDAVAWTPFVPTGLPASPDQIHGYREYFLARVGTDLYASEDGISWALGSAPARAKELLINRHTLLAVTTGGKIFQPGGETGSGPWLKLPETHRAVTIPRNQSITYRLEAGDDDGDLDLVQLRINDELVSSLSEPPYEFQVKVSTPGKHALEFSARDLDGRISRSTAELTVVASGTNAPTAYRFNHSTEFTHLGSFKGKLYASVNGMPWSADNALWSSEDGVHWSPVGLSISGILSVAANEHAIIVVTESGIQVSNDGVSWIYLKGLDSASYSIRRVVAQDGNFHLTTQSEDLAKLGHWVSEDGLDWSWSASPFPEPAIKWVDAKFGHRFGPFGSPAGETTHDGGRSWFELKLENLVIVRDVIPLDDSFLILASIMEPFVFPDPFNPPQDRLFRLDRGTFDLVEVAFPVSSHRPGTLNLIDGRAYLGFPDSVLVSTVDGIQFLTHGSPPNRNRSILRRRGNLWVSQSIDMIATSTNLDDWEVVIDYYAHLHPAHWSINDGTNLRLPPRPDGALVYDHDGERTTIGADGSITREALDPADTLSSQRGVLGIRADFADSILMAGRWIFRRPAGSQESEWQPVTLVAASAEALPDHIMQSLPSTGGAPFSIRHAAATANAYVAVPSDPYVDGVIIRSDDGENFRVHHFQSPEPPSRITFLASSPGEFVASLGKDGVLRSTDGLSWNRHVFVPGLEIDSLFHFDGRWFASCRKPNIHDGSTWNSGWSEIWSSPDGANWTKVWHRDHNGFPGSPNYSFAGLQSFNVAHGVARVRVAELGWLRSTNGQDWTPDTAFEDILRIYNVFPRGEHPEGILFDRIANFSTYGIYIIDPDSGEFVRSVEFDPTTQIHWINNWPYFSQGGHLTRWVEADPRLEAISSTPGTYGVGSIVDVELTSREIPADSRIRFFLDPGSFLNDGDSIPLASIPWSLGQPNTGAVRTFRIPLPPAVNPGSFRIAASFEIPRGMEDSGYQNNTIASPDKPIEIPGYRLTLEQVGEGTVSGSDLRPLYPQGAPVSLTALPGNGYTVAGWEGSLVSASSEIALLMDSDQALTVTFVQGWTTTVRSVGGGHVSGTEGTRILEPDTVLNLDAESIDGWTFSHWDVNGTAIGGSSLILPITGDTLIQGVFVPDFVALRNKAFNGAPPEIDRAWNLDPDGDGLSTYLEILLGTSPHVPSRPFLHTGKQGDTITFIFRRPEAIGEPWITPEFSDNLLTWQADPPSGTSVRRLSIRDGIETIEISFRTGALPSAYLQLESRGDEP